MMPIDFVTRSEWGARAPTGSYGNMPDPVSGVKYHYTGGKENPAMLTDHNLCVSRVKSIQNAHMDGNGWLDIGYSYVVCHHRKVFVGRGLHNLPAANGSGLNSGHYAVCALVGSSGITEPTDELLHGLCDILDYIRVNAPAGNQVKGHRDGYPTECPGDPLYAWVQAGAPRPNSPTTPPIPTGDEMDVVSLGLVSDVEVPGRNLEVLGVLQPWWTDEFSDASNWHPANGQSIAPSVPVWGDFSAQVFLYGVTSWVDLSYVRTDAAGVLQDVAAGPYRFYPNEDGRVEAQLHAKFKLSGTNRARLQIENHGDPCYLESGPTGSMFKAFLFRD